MDREQHRAAAPARGRPRAAHRGRELGRDPLDVALRRALARAALHVRDDHAARAPGRDAGVRRARGGVPVEGEPEEGEGARARRVLGRGWDVGS